MRTVAFVIFAFAIAFPPRVHAIVDPTRMYHEMEKRIAEIKESQSQIADALVSVNLAKEERKQLQQWKKSLDEEREILVKRLDLLKKLQRSGIITYISSEEEKNTNAESKNS